MTYPFEFSEQALEDLADLWTFFDQKFGARTAQKHVDEVFARVREMTDFPESGVPHQGRRSGVRRWRAGLYFILYSFDGELIRVQRVLNTRRGDLETEV
jgi:plasmid stabilization system protein ParE